MAQTLIDAMKRWATRTPHALFLQEEQRQWSFKQFDDDVAGLAAFFLHKGVRKGDFVVVHLEKKSEHLLTYMALLSIGAVCVHLYPERDDAYVRFAAEHCNARFIVSSRFAGTVEGVTVIKRLACTACAPLIRPDINPLAYIMFTSGTTSTPKAVQITHESLMFVAKTLAALAGMRENGERELIFMPLGSTGGLGHFHAALLLGNSIRLFPGLYSRLDANALTLLCDTIEREKITGMLFTPSLITRMLTDHKAHFKRAGASLRYLLANVTPMRRETILELLQTLPEVRFCTYYGSTEASRSIVNVCRDNPGHEHFTGRPAPGVEIRLVSPPGENAGEVYIKGPNVMTGYLHRGSDGFDGEWFKSGDLAERDDAGFIRVLGRIKETINIDGLKLFPGEIEALLLGHEKIEDAGVCALEDRVTYQRIGLAVVSGAEDRTALVRELFRLFETRYADALCRYKIPKALYFVDRIPRTDLGKIRREALARQLDAHREPYTLQEAH